MARLVTCGEGCSLVMVSLPCLEKLQRIHRWHFLFEKFVLLSETLGDSVLLVLLPGHLQGTMSR